MLILTCLVFYNNSDFSILHADLFVMPEDPFYPVITLPPKKLLYTDKKVSNSSFKRLDMRVFAIYFYLWSIINGSVPFKLAYSDDSTRSRWFNKHLKRFAIKNHTT